MQSYAALGKDEDKWVSAWMPSKDIYTRTYALKTVGKHSFPKVD